MPNLQTPTQPLAVSDFTNAVKSIIELLEDKYPPTAKSAEEKLENLKNPQPWRRSSLSISDVIDNNGSQYVDLVQEGGGIHGIALAGYTYVLEKMGVAFSKMAGTSAGSINTMLLSAVTTKDELAWLQQWNQDTRKGAKAWEEQFQYKAQNLKPENYYETRSEKILEYLAGKDLSDLVDGHPNWRSLILQTFRGQVKFDNIKGYFKKIKKTILFSITSLVLLFISGFALLFLKNQPVSYSIAKWVYVVSGVVFLFTILSLIIKAIKGKKLYNHSERFGVNPGDNFESWVKQILDENEIGNISKLKNKLQQEQSCLQFRYVPAVSGYNPSSGKSTFNSNDNADKSLKTGMEKLKSQCVEKLNISPIEQGKSKKLINEEIKDQMDELTMNVTKSAKEISPDNPEKEIRSKELVNTLVEINILKTTYLDYYDEGLEMNKPFKKEIAIVSSDITNEIKAEFPAMHKIYWGENFSISPAKYVRASMSIPGFFKPFKIFYDFSQREVMEREWKELMNIELRLEEKDKFALLVDGGLLSNFPVNIFYNPDSPLPSIPTVGVKLEFEDDLTQNFIENEKQLMGAMVNTMRFFYDRDFISKHNIFKKTVRSIDTGKIHWLNFALSDKDKIELFFRGALTAAIFLLGKENESSRAESVRQLIQMGKSVSFKETNLCIYENPEVPVFLTEDNWDEYLFNWEKYKMERILLIGEQNAQRNKFKGKAAYVEKPNQNNTSQY